MSTRDLGGKGESLATEILQKNGYQILQRNFRCKIGEIDIICIDPSASSGQALVFVEVKTRWTKEFGLPEEAITPWKIRKIARTADFFVLLHPELPKLLRIDAVCLDLSENPGKVKIIRNLTG